MTEQKLDLLRFPLHDSRLIEASAGTGKTYTIAALYLRLILGHGAEHSFSRALTPPDILVVTFTEAATQELRERIRSRLSDAATAFLQHHSNDSMLAGLIQSYPQAQHAACARQLELAAQWMDDAAISTIHSWCNRMLSEHAFACGSLFNQQLETDQSLLQLQAVRDYWRTFYYSLNEAAFSVIQQCWATPDNLWRVITPVMSLYSHNDFADAAIAEPASLIEQTLAEKQLLLQQLKQRWQPWLPELSALLLSGIERKQVDGRKLQKRYVDGWLGKLQQWCDDEQAEKPELGTGWQRLTSDGIQDAWKGEAPQHPAFGAIAELQTALDHLPQPRTALIQHAAQWVKQRFYSEQQQRATMGFDDMLHRLWQALQSEQGPQLAELIRKQFPVAMIDEFQDTDPLQYRIFNAIYQLALSGPERAVLLIGDPKQAIYAFRGADIYTYLQAKQATTGRHYTLDTNFRATAEMVAAVNRLFHIAEQRASGAFLFRQAGQETIPFLPVKAKGRADKLLVNKQPQPAMTFWYLPEKPAKPLPRQQYLQLFAQSCAAEICRLLNEAETGATGFITDSSVFTPLQPSDIAVLVNNRQEAQAIRQALAERAVRSVYLSDKDSVFSSPQAFDLLLLLKACAEPQQEQLLRAALGCATLQLDISYLDSLNQNELLWEKLTEQFKGYQLRWQQHGILPMLRSLLFDFNVPSRLAAQTAGERALTDLLHLAELLQQASSQLDGEQALLRYLHEHISGEGELSADEQKVRLESDAGLVKVVTIHKSKGLEYGLVFLPFISSARAVKRDALPVAYHTDDGVQHYSFEPDDTILQQAEHERLAEDIRKLYVAVTRAKYACWLGLAPLETTSAIVRILFDEKPEPDAFAEQLLQAWNNQSPIQLQPLPQPDTGTYIETQQSEQPLVARKISRYFREHWWIASYSALAQQALDMRPATERGIGADEIFYIAEARDEQLAELQHEVFPAEQYVDPAVQYQFIAGPEAGTFLHGILEWAARQQFAVIAGQPQYLEQELVRRCQLKGWPSDSNLAVWLHHLLIQPLSLAENTPPLVLSQLRQYQPEMEFWFSCQQVSYQALDDLLMRHIWPGLARPALIPGVLNGMLKGFIDLVFEHDGRFYVCDYKSNLLGQNAAAYQFQALQQAMLAKRYDLQAVLYCLALHRLLKNRLPDYSYQQHIGGAVHWFVRGYQAAANGLISITPSQELIMQLDKLFSSGNTDTGSTYD
ncbi:exodeoxyribonuclease V subunit beta [Chromatiaceae bacterium AAb-1]|nr:exodeoxyribonuclease V subunit beta [Chromatiaceae bacterium AAb-1]